ncbi:uncharacterized protein TRIADDRAFT_29505 [Trichoplax adhaerens]|uniref:Anaphase-promoting complex subunit 13 n=1 Tax=Trichoplax adhaerens TaxID=10228 RepID=B3S5T6_TRIAD|nr:hypothetical protein TRIADDRAFT_29505 [Trichoplax adhaerens]EDV21852.1 hypothetical protein TRIADDRAFT_29505 [Trichoplax adhaerens]|eukprot:XP_002115489.1 hypothetical protein TRIADDRAFT_29505 [Trichoplax adhaerens]
MDSQYAINGRLVEIIDDEWKKDSLPVEHVPIPLNQLPNDEGENEFLNTCSLSTGTDEEKKWTDSNVLLEKLR